MSKYIASSAIRGAHELIHRVDKRLQEALAQYGPEAKVEFTNTAYYLPIILGMTGMEVKTLGDMVPALEYCRDLLQPVPSSGLWTPYLGTTLDAGMATLMAEEILMGIGFVDGTQPEPFDWEGSYASPAAKNDKCLNGPIDDIQLRAWGIQLVDGRMPGFAAVLGCAKSNEVAVQIVRELQRRNILVFLSGNVNGRSIVQQLMEEGVELGYDTYTVPFGTNTESTCYALGFATRSALTFGGLKGGQAKEILEYNEHRTFAFALGLGPIDDLKYATAAGAINYGFPAIADTRIPNIFPSGLTLYEAVVSMPFDEIEGRDDIERADRLVQRCIEVRGVKLKITEVPIPVPYGSAFEGERVRKDDMRIEFGGKYSRAFEYLRMLPMDEVEDHKIELIGPGFEDVPEGEAMDLGIIVEVAGRKMQEDFEPVLERQIHYFTNGASGVQHIGQRDIAWIRISKTAAQKGFELKHFGEILYARMHADFGAILDKVQVKIITDPEEHALWLEKARAAYDVRNRRLGEMTDESVDTFYSCTLCLPEGEQIILPDGSFMPVEHLVDTVVEERNLDVLSFNSHGLTVRPVGELFINPSPARLIKVTLSNGNTLTLTANHEVLVDKPDDLAWIPAGELHKGDYVASVEHTAIMETEAKEHYIIDCLPDDYEISDDDFYAQLRELVLAKFGSIAEAARRLGIDYNALCGVFRRGSHRSLTIGEMKRLVNAARLDWDEVKGQIHLFKPNCRLLKTKLDEDMMYLAGLVASDGCISWRRERNTAQLSFANTEQPLIEKFGQICRDFVAATPRIYEKASSTTRWYECYVYNPLICELLAGLGIKAQDYGGEWHGEIMSALPPGLIAAFLRGLFDGDGDVCVTDTGPRFAFTTKSARQAQHIHLLLKKLGIDSTITHRSRPTEVYRVRTRGRYAFARFRELIGSEHPVKRAKMGVELSFEAAGRRFYNSTPWRCGWLVKELLERWSDKIRTTKLPIDYKTLQTWIKGQRRPSKGALGRFLEGIADLVDPNDPTYQELLAWSCSEVSFERVKAIEKVDSLAHKVYNFSVNGTQNYVVNGVIAHNCQSFAPNHVCIISPERLGLCGAYNYLDAAASYQINPTGSNQPVQKGSCSDPVKGYWDNINQFVQEKSHGMVQKVSLYSIMEDPMTSCFTADAEVIVDGQPVHIGDLVDEQINNRWYYSSALTLKDGGQAGYDRIVGMHQNPAPETLFRVATKSGNEMVLTGNHAIAVDRPEGLTWVRADQLRVGERVYALRHLDLPARLPDVVDLLPDTFRVDEAALLDDLKGRLKARYGSLAAAYREAGISPLDSRTTSIPIGTLKRLVAALGEDWSQVKKTISKVTLGGGSTDVLPKLDGDLFYLMGLLASDGSLSRQGKHVNADQGLLAAFEETYSRVFPSHNLGLAKKEVAESVLHGRKIQPTQECFSYYGANPLLGALCEAFGIKMTDEKRWDLGRMISLPEEAIAAFIAGCFDGDGSVRLRQHDGRWETGEAYLCIEDERAAHHLQLLLKRLDIVGNIRPSGAVFKIELHGNNLRRFAEVIPARHPAKKQTLQEIAALPRESLDKTQAEVLPYAVGKALASLSASREVLSPSTLYYYETARSRPVRDNLQKVVDAWPETAPLLKPFLDSDTFLDIVAEVEPIENRGQYSHVYNLTLMDFHNYFANQTLVKNCGCFECIMMIIPEANGFMTVSREDPSMTPAGMTFSTLAGTAGGGLQTPGVMGHGKFFITSKKFIKADGGLKRIVWMSSFLKESMAEELKEAAIREGDPDLIDKIADERVATTVEELLAYIEEKGHPALTMPPLF